MGPVRCSCAQDLVVLNTSESFTQERRHQSVAARGGDWACIVTHQAEPV